MSVHCLVQQGMLVGTPSSEAIWNGIFAMVKSIFKFPYFLGGSSAWVHKDSSSHVFGLSPPSEALLSPVRPWHRRPGGSSVPPLFGAGSARGGRLWFLGAVLFNLQIIESAQKWLPKVPWLVCFQESDQTILLVLKSPRVPWLIYPTAAGNHCFLCSWK